METLFSIVGFWGHVGAAALFAALAIWLFQREESSGTAYLSLVVAASLTAFWALSVAVEGPTSGIANFGESLRNLAWLAFMFALLRTDPNAFRPPTINAIYITLALVGTGQIAVDLVAPMVSDSPRIAGMAVYTSLVLRMLFAVAALVLVHNLYTVCAVETRARLRLPMGALAVLWTYDLNLYTITYLTQQFVVELQAMRGPVTAALVPALVLASWKTGDWTLKMSRSVAFRSLSLVAIATYLCVMVVVATALQIIGGDYAWLAQLSFLFGTTVAAIVLLPSGRFKAWVKVVLQKNFFQHRYDYRAEWLRFTDTIGRPGQGSAPFHERVVQAVADVTESPAGLLLMPDDGGRLTVQARWNWATMRVPGKACTARTISFFEESGHIVEFDRLREADDRSEPTPGDCDPDAIPDWMTREPSIWAAVPLVHFDRLAGIVVLARPTIDRTLDWEDFDLLRVVGRQVASYLAEARSQESLSETRRFDEFNRRMAFVMHDLKNLVSQLSLLARNAQRHADNPAFRDDMIATLTDCADKMNGLLARLSQHNKAKPEEPRPVPLRELVETATAAAQRMHPIELIEIEELTVVADPARVEQLLGHIIQNAIDASAPGASVAVRAFRRDLSVAIEVVDDGCGMSSEFVRSQLFKPFASTKPGGFGIGAYEARSLAQSMDGRLEVESREGHGSRFTLILPLARTQHRDDDTRERAA